MKKVTLFCLAAIMLLSGCASSKNTAKTINNIPQTADEQFILGGKIATNEKADISSKVSAKIDQISVDVGSKVKEGDILAKLDTKDLQSQVDEAQAAVNTAKANLSNAQNNTRPEQISQAQISVDSAYQNYQTVKKNYDRVQALVKSGAAAQQELDSASQQITTSQAQYKTAQEQLDMLKNGPTKSSIDVFKAQVDQSEAALKAAETMLSNAVITAPISGTVSSRNVNIGDTVSPGSVIVSIVNPTNLFINAYAPLDVVSQLSVGQAVDIKISEIPDKEFHGKVSVINSQVNAQSRDVLVKVTLTDKYSNLKPGMFAEIALQK
ncbi:MAG: efflux RND transporter periplasmic adaptor subunit [Clostridium sp.]|jgi:multidrug resistance efflux pump|uniref:HlyD family secretion protein n=1 Tax=Clostridium sp. TaxID=1506 RepID=UPI0025C18991|nr:efflux RND transporter periplasmic adaptor subunit [Clostridium sp.]MCH3965824.1 efflux RND transporter periplasmic adaptor subunit [Clostridium sp.]MCI1716087.1 efflux RND transporter periplasmic adaptor subunit [Clostridium sp.]MCI1800241.1 efflux RND transporter periplasmic adaptor subunit [Clostridium sp.]MCI1814264.1 efflux RND transporter periplasmic adaptor subunit [Clostridium sp.]MCI1871163.1 efflux RND transporter periplasmic adaptor subunit [Clostridium sp.]